MKKCFPILLLLIMGCASTSTTIVRIKEESINSPNYTSILVSAPYDDLEIKSYVETLFADALRNSTVYSYKAINILPPLREYSMTDISQKLREKNIELILVVAVADFWETYYKLPDRSVTNYNSHSKVDNYGSLLSIKTKGSATTTYYPGIKLSQSNVKLDTRLFEVTHGDSLQMIWRANSTTSGNYFTAKSKVMRDAATKIAVGLVADNILKFCPYSSKRPRIYKVTEDVFIMGGLNHDIMLGCLSYIDSDFESVFCKNGIYYLSSENPLWNRQGIHASDISDCSACNPNASSPPIITNMEGEVLGWLSLNDKFKTNNKLHKWMKYDEWKWQTIKLKDWLRKRVCNN